MNIEEALSASFFLPYSVGALAILCTCIYVVNVMKWVLTWRRTKQYEAADVGVPISVVVALHNEAGNIDKMLHSLINQSTAIDEVILVCDHCNDDTELILKKIINDNPQFNARVIINSGEPGKKNAQRLGVSQSRNEYVAVIDGDCIARKDWHKTLASILAKRHSDMLIMPVRMNANDNSVVQELMELEFVSLQLATAATAINGHPTMCNGANMAFKKDLYMSHDGNMEYTSGDDMFLLSEIKRNGGKIDYIKSASSVVETTCPTSIQTYYRQRTRWLRKATGYTDKDVKKLAMTVAIGNAAWPLSCILLTIGIWWVGLTCFIMKTASEMMLLWQGRNIWKHRWNIIYIILLAIIYPFVLFSITTLTIFRNKKRW